MTITTASALALHIADRMAGITKANGYKTDIGLRVFRGKRKIDDTHPPCAVLLEGEDRPGGQQGGASQQITQSYVLGGYDHCDPDHPNDRAHEIISDLKRAIFVADTARIPGKSPGSVTFDGQVKEVHYRGRDIGPRADGVAIVFAIIFIDVVFVEQLNAA